MIVAAILMVTVQAQDKPSTKISIAANAGIPTTGELVIAAGADLQADFGKITLSAGYEGQGRGLNFFPLLAGLKFPFFDNCYGHAQLGYVFGVLTVLTPFYSGGDHKESGFFGYAPSIGYKFSSNFDASVKYLVFRKTVKYDVVFGKNRIKIANVNLRFAYSF